MLSLLKSSVAACLFAAMGVTSLPELLNRATTCAPTIESSVTVPHSCYAFTAVTPPATGCPIFECPAITCVKTETTTLSIPPSDPCCPRTTTTTTQGSCKSCPTGCLTVLETATVTTTPEATTTAINYKRDTSSSLSASPCTTTIFRAQSFLQGPTKTIYPNTVTKTEWEDCGACKTLVVRNINGPGPVVIFTTTISVQTPTTTTAYACSSTATY